MLAILFTLLTVLAHGDENIFAKIDDQQLAALRAKALARIELATRYDLARNGHIGETSPDAVEAARADFAAAVAAYERATDVRYPYTEACSRYIGNMHKLILALKKGYEKAIFKVQDGKEALVLRTRVEAIGFLLRNEIQLADENSEGGQAPITDKGTECSFIDRATWLETAHGLRRAVIVFNATLWGEPGVANPYLVSNQLLRILNDQERSRNRWALAELSAAGVVLGFTSKRIMPLLKIALGSEVTRYLQIATGLAITSYGAYRGYLYMANRQNSPGWSRWSELQASAEELLSLGAESTQTYYVIAYGMEKNKLRHNMNVINELEPQVQMAIARYGSLEKATAASEKKLAEIDAEIANRKKENK